jgi:hypothetical protein
MLTWKQGGEEEQRGAVKVKAPILPIYYLLLKTYGGSFNAATETKHSFLFS